jgi:hypothetical protein
MRVSWESFSSASSPGQCNSELSTQYSASVRFNPLRWMCRCIEWDIGAQSRLLWTGARCAITALTHLTSPFHYYHVRSFSGQLSVFPLCGRNLQHVLQSFLRLHISIRCTSVIEGIFTRSLSHRICRSSFSRVFFKLSLALFVALFADSFEIFCRGVLWSGWEAFFSTQHCFMRLNSLTSYR